MGFVKRCLGDGKHGKLQIHLGFLHCSFRSNGPLILKCDTRALQKQCTIMCFVCDVHL